MKIISAVGGKVVLEHVKSDGNAIKLEVEVDNDSRKFIKDNLNQIRYDVTNHILKLHNGNSSTTVARAFARAKFDIPNERNILFKDGNKFNLKSKNICTVE